MYMVAKVVLDLGWVDSGLGRSLCFLAATVATYRLGRMVEHPKNIVIPYYKHISESGMLLS